MFLFESHQHFFGRGILPGFRFLGFAIQFEFLEQQFTHLLRAIDIKRCSGQGIDTLLQGIKFSGQRGFRLLEFAYIHPHTGHFHIPQHFHQR